MLVCLTFKDWFQPERRFGRARSLVSQTSGMPIAAINKAAATRPAGVARAVAVMAMEIADAQVHGCLHFLGVGRPGFFVVWRRVGHQVVAFIRSGSQVRHVWRVRGGRRVRRCVVGGGGGESCAIPFVWVSVAREIVKAERYVLPSMPTSSTQLIRSSGAVSASSAA